MDILKGKKIKIFVSLHDDFFVPANALLQPIQVGAAIAEQRLESVLHDDEGDNISEKNKMYSEVTAQYWAWKNMLELDYYGFFHYRRYLSFSPVQLEHWENITYFDYCDDVAVEKLMLREGTMRSLIERYDVIYPQANPMGGDTVYEHWCKHLVKKDLDVMVQVIMEKYPEFYELTRKVLNAKEAIHCNMFIMKKDFFYRYSEWLFDILEECEKRIDFSDYSTEKLRTMGHLSERLCAIYGKYLEENGARICYVQKALFRNNEVSRTVQVKDAPKQIPIVLSCNNEYIKYTSVLIESMIKNASVGFIYRIYIMHTDITKENMRILEEQAGAAPAKNFEIDFIDVRRRMAEYKSLPVDRHLSIETYYRFFVLDVFPNLSKILYLDCDTVANEDVASLFQEDIGNKSLGAVRDVDIISLYPKENKADPEVRENIDMVLKLNNYENYFQAGVLLFNLRNIRERYSGGNFLDMASRRKWKFQDQDILNYFFKNDVYYLPLKWNVLYECFNREERVEKFTSRLLSSEYKKAKQNPGIIHYAGTPKPWDDIQADMGGFFWKYAKTSPFFESIIHDMNIRIYRKNCGSPEQSDGASISLRYRFSDVNNMINDLRLQLDRVTLQRDDLQWRLDETRKSFSYRLGMMLTYLPRKIRGRKRGD